MANNTFRAEFIYENLQMQNNIIHQSYLHGVKKLLFLGSSCIYPKNCPQPIKEEYLLTGELEYTNEPYAIAKIAGRTMTESYNLQYGTNFISVMPTNMYGPNDNFDLSTSHVLPALIRKMHLGKLLASMDYEAICKDFLRYKINKDHQYLSATDIQALKPQDIATLLKKYGIYPSSIALWGSGKPRREFLYSDDLASACLFLMENIDFVDLNDTKLIRNCHLNIGSGEDMTIGDLAVLVKKIVGYQGDISWNPAMPDGTFQKLLDVSKINQLGWKSSISLEVGIQNVYNVYRDRVKTFWE